MGDLGDQLLEPDRVRQRQRVWQRRLRAAERCKFGPEFQCEELAIRYAYYAWGEPTNWYGYGAVGGANTMWQAGPNLPVPLVQFPNGAGTPPMQGDLMIFAPGWLGSYWDGSGHVAIVRDVGPGYVDVVEQNATLVRDRPVSAQWVDG